MGIANRQVDHQGKWTIQQKVVGRGEILPHFFYCMTGNSLGEKETHFHTLRFKKKQLFSHVELKFHT
jgi:hypothetical protein